MGAEEAEGLCPTEGLQESAFLLLPYRSEHQVSLCHFWVPEAMGCS